LASPGGLGTGLILVGVDFSEGSNETLAWAAKMEIAVNATLVLLHSRTTRRRRRTTNCAITTTRQRNSSESLRK
jgi:hypothetical protein